MATISAVSQQLIYAKLPLTFTDIANPPGDAVAVAIVAPTVDPQTSDWKTAAWKAGGPPYVAQLLVGPGSSFGALVKGNYRVWLKITDAAEVPEMRVDWLRVT